MFLKSNPHTLYVCNNILLSKGDQCGRFLFCVTKKTNQKSKSKLIPWYVREKKKKSLLTELFSVQGLCFEKWDYKSSSVLWEVACGIGYRFLVWESWRAKSGQVLQATEQLLFRHLGDLLVTKIQRKCTTPLSLSTQETYTHSLLVLE